MGRDDSLDILIRQLHQKLINLIQSYLVVLPDSSLQLRDIPDNLAPFLAALASLIDPKPDDLGVVGGQGLDVRVLSGV